MPLGDKRRAPATSARGLRPHAGKRLPSVLIVDDDAEERDIARAMLEASRRFRIVAEAEDGRQGILQAATCRPDLVLLDIDMPRMGGLEALPSIQRVSPTSKVVFFSGRSPESAAPGWDKLGAAGYIEKGEDWTSVIGKLILMASERFPVWTRNA